MTTTDAPTHRWTLMGRQNAVRAAMLAVIHDWPTARVTPAPDGLSAVLVVKDPLSTYVITVDAPQPGDAGAVVESLWVSHRDGGHVEGSAPAWTDGWVD